MYDLNELKKLVLSYLKDKCNLDAMTKTIRVEFKYNEYTIFVRAYNSMFDAEHRRYLDIAISKYMLEMYQNEQNN